MRDDARAAAAIGILDDVLSGRRAEVALTGWARGNRYAGSKDRAAIRDIVFDILRRRGSCARAGGGLTGRALVLGWVRLDGRDPADVFTGARYAPDCLNTDEAAQCDLPIGEVDPWLDLPEWLVPDLKAALGPRAGAYAQAMQSRAEVFLRVNRLKATPAAAQAALDADGIGTEALDGDALRVTANARRVAAASAYRDGLVELQDGSSQALVAALPLDGPILDYCAGGGGKALALAARTGAEVFAWDVDPARMADIPVRAARAGAHVTRLDQPGDRAPYGLVLCDAPCSGTGSWRRDADARWRLTPQALAKILATQASILDRAAALVRPGGHLAWATCSVLTAENEDQVAAFIDRSADSWAVRAVRFDDFDRGDGFGLSILTRVES